MSLPDQGKHVRQNLDVRAADRLPEGGTYGCGVCAQYYRLAAKRGSKRALVAVAHSILVIAYHILRDGTVYQELGPNYFDERSKEATARRAVKRLERLGFKVTIEQAA